MVRPFLTNFPSDLGKKIVSYAKYSTRGEGTPSITLSETGDWHQAEREKSQAEHCPGFFRALTPQGIVNEGGKEELMDVAPVEGGDPAGEMDVPAVSHGDGRSGEPSHPMQVDFGEVGAHLKGVDVIVVGDGYDLAGQAREAVVVGNVGEDRGAALDFMDMGLGGDHLLSRGELKAVQADPSCLQVLYSICGRASPGTVPQFQMGSAAASRWLTGTSSRRILYANSKTRKDHEGD